MNPEAEQKAQELIEQFKPMMYCYIGSGMLTNDYNEELAVKNAKECLNIIITDMLRVIPYTISRGRSGMVRNASYDYWQEVKNSINNQR